MSTLTDKLPTIDIDLTEAKKPLLAAVGVIDLTVEQAKEIPATAKLEAKKLQAKVSEAVAARRTARSAQLKTVPAQLKTVPAQLKALPAQLTEKATELRTGTQARVAKAQTTFVSLTVRGEKLVAQIRKQETTKAAIAEGKAAVKKAETATTAAKKATKAAVKAVETATEKIG